MGKRPARITAMLLLATLLISACASGPASSPTGIPTGTPTQAPEPSLPASLTVGTAIPGISPSGSGTSSGGLAASATPGGSTPAADMPEVTLSSNRTTLTLHVGQAFLLKLGDIYIWNVQVADPAIVSREVNVLVVRGAQGIYQAHEAGTTRLTAQGDPACRKSVPACAMPSIAFQITLVVEP